MVECFSRLESVRCQGLSRTSHVILYLPVGLEILLVPVLLGLTWRRPRATIIFLLIEILLSDTVATWSLLAQLVPPSPDSFRSQDLALGAISALPILFILLFANSLLVSDLRSCLPKACLTNASALFLSFVMVPLIPIAFVGTLMGNILFVVYLESLSSVRVGFEKMPYRKANHALAIAGIVAAAVLITFVACISNFIIIYKQSRARWMLDFPSLPSLVLISAGLAVESASIGIGVVNESFGLIMTRSVLKLASRVLLTIGMAGSYYPLSKVDPPNTSERPRPPLALVRSPRRPARETGMTIGGPVAGTFTKMDASTTRSFHQQSLHRTGSRGGGVPHHDRVISRHSPHRGPKLSFTPSTFDQTNLSSLAEAVRNRDQVVPESEIMGEESQNPFLSPEEQQDRRRHLQKNIGSIYRPKLVSVDERELTHWPPASDTCQERHIHLEWALRRQSPDSEALPIISPPTNFPIPHLSDREPVLTPTGSLSGQVLSARLNPGERVGQVSALRTVDQLHPTPERRGSSSRRKRVPRDLGSPNQSMEGILSFISTSTTPAPPGSPALSPSTEAAWETSLRDSLPRRVRRRETDPTRAVMTRSVGDESSIYSQPSQHPDDFALFYRAPLSSPSSSSPAKSVRSPVPFIPPRRNPIRTPPSAMLHDRSTRYQSESEVAMSSLDRVRRDTGVDLDIDERRLTPLPRDSGMASGRGSGSVMDSSPGMDRFSTTTWVSDDISPRASERGWWSNVNMGN